MIRGFAGRLSSEPHERRESLVTTMRQALGNRARYVGALQSQAEVCIGSGSLIPESIEPGLSLPTGWCVCVDARFDDRSRLAKSLGCFDTDEAVVLASYRRWGPDCVKHLSGDFALAVWDPQTESLFLARDRFGVRPLTYTAGAGWFCFASEAKALLALPDISWTSSEQKIAEFLRCETLRAEDTMFNDIARLPAGHRMIVRRDDIKTDRYWEWKLPPVQGGSDLPEQLREVFTRAVQRRVPSSEPVGVTLSGGLDSSSIAATLAGLERFKAAPVSTYSIVFDRDEKRSERRYIESLTQRGNYSARFLSLEPEDPFRHFDRQLFTLDGLFFAPTLAMAPDLLSGLPPGAVVLDGHGGDEVISHGYERLYDLAQTRDWVTFLREASGASRVTSASTAGVLLAYYHAYGKGGWRLKSVQRLMRNVSRRTLPPLTLSKELAARSAPRIVPQLAASMSGRERHMMLLADPAQQYALEVLDRKAVSSGYETRFPFWDQELVNLSLAISSDQKLRGGWTRRIMRDAMGGVLPDDIRWRRDKHDFSHHIAEGLKISRAASAERFKADSDKLRPFLDLEAVETIQRRTVAGGGVVSGQDFQSLWRATAVAEWLAYAETHNIKITS